MTTTSETYKVSSFEMAEKLSKMDGTDDGKYNGLPIEVFFSIGLKVEKSLSSDCWTRTLSRSCSARSTLLCWC